MSSNDPRKNFGASSIYMWFATDCCKYFGFLHFSNRVFCPLFALLKTKKRLGNGLLFTQEQDTDCIKWDITTNQKLQNYWKVYTNLT